MGCNDAMIQQGATFSDDRIYRWNLSRLWDEKLPVCTFICLNPSTADESLNDPTVRRCMNFAAQWGYGKLITVNLFAFRATNPEVMKRSFSPRGSENDEFILKAFEEAELTVAAWGNDGKYMNRGREVCDLLDDELHCLGLTQNGEPKHPLYLKKDLKPYRMFEDK